MADDAQQHPHGATSKQDPRKVAEFLGEELEKVSIELLTPRQYALFCDADGLLLGIAEGRISGSHPRICHDLIEVLSLFGDRFDRITGGTKEHAEAYETMHRLANVISGAAVNGLSLERSDDSLGRDGQGRGRR